MSAFTSPGLKLNFTTDDRDAVLLDPIAYELVREGSGRVVQVPVGFQTDGISAPRIFWSLLPPWGSKLSKAAIIHDYLISRLAIGLPVEGYGTRRAIDGEFYTAVRALGAGRFEATVYWAFLRLWALVS